MKLSKLMCISASIIALSLVGCADDTDGSSASSYTDGTVTLLKNQGVDFATGALQDPGNVVNSEIRLTNQSAKLELRSGGPSTTKERPVNWFSRTSGYESFSSLEAVPNSPLPAAGQNLPLLNAEAGHGFIVQRADLGYVKGWIIETTDDSVTIAYTPIP